jgi:exonuclease SbcC
MRITKIKIKNLFGISETELDGRNIELSGSNGTGKTSVIDAIRYALTNQSDRDYIIRNGEKEGEILIEAGADLYINRKKRTDKADYKSVKEAGREIGSPESMLKTLFTPLQLNPVEFTQMTKAEQNRVILDLIEYDWDLNWIREQFGEIPPDVNYEQNILQVLNDIQSEKGYYFQERQNVNRDIRNNRALIEDISKDIPSGYQADKWEAFDLSAKYHELEKIRQSNDLIMRAKAFKDSYDNKMRGYEAKKEISISSNERAIASERESLKASIERLKAEQLATEEKLKGLDAKLEDKNRIAIAEFETKVAKLQKDIGTANEYIDKPIVDTTALSDEISTAEEMKRHLNEYARLKAKEKEIEQLTEVSNEFTRKIELARKLPGEILETATLPVDGLTVENGIPLINGLPVTNLSEGEKLELCVDVALSKPNSLQVILIDGVERLSDSNRERLYAKCKEKGLQFIATRTTNSDELEINYL